VQRGPHERGAHHLTIAQAPEERFRPEALEAGPKAEERRLGLLGLHAAQALDGLHDRDLLALEQHLTRQRGAVELSDGERLRLHRRTVR